MENQLQSHSENRGFKRAAVAEWSRLNPRYVRPGDDIRATFVIGFREGLHAYFAPLRMLFWLVSYSVKPALKLVQG